MMGFMRTIYRAAWFAWILWHKLLLRSQRFWFIDSSWTEVMETYELFVTRRLPTNGKHRALSMLTRPPFQKTQESHTVRSAINVTLRAVLACECRTSGVIASEVNKRFRHESNVWMDSTTTQQTSNNHNSSINNKKRKYNICQEIKQ